MRYKLLPLMAAGILAAQATSAGTTDAYYDEATGQIVIPHLKGGDGEYFYARLNLTDINALTFQADFQTLTDISPPAEVGDTVNTDVSQILGTWTISGMTIEDVYVTFNEDGSYELFEDTDDEGCSTGTEIGTYNWVPTTGILLTTVESDENGDCGLSHPKDGVPYRVYISDEGMQLLDNGSTQSPLEEFALVKVS